jgi:hypothetical protein
MKNWRKKFYVLDVVPSPDEPPLNIGIFTDAGRLIILIKAIDIN